MDDLKKNDNIVIDVLCFTETHLNSNIINNINFPDFTLASSFSRQSKRQGGVCIYIRNNINFTCKDVSAYCLEVDFECCCIEIEIEKVFYTIISVYRAPNGNFKTFTTKLNALLCNVFKTNRHIIVCGDFNVNYMSDSTHKRALNGTMKTFNLKSVVDFPTRIQIKSSSCIDNIFINSDASSTSKVSKIVNGLSDHDAQLLMYNALAEKRTSNINKYQNVVKIGRLLKEENILDFKCALSSVDWRFLNVLSDPNLQLNDFLNCVLKLFETYCPLFAENRIQRKTSKPWITNEIKKLCETKRMLYTLYKQSGQTSDKILFKAHCNIVKKAIFKEKSLYYENCMNKSGNKIKTVWNMMKNELGQKKKTNTNWEIEINNEIVKDKFAIANAFNDYYIKMGDKLNSEQNVKSTTSPLIYLTKHFKNDFPKIQTVRTKPNEIKNIIKKLKVKNSCGYDGLSSKIVKYCTSELCRPLSTICNNILGTGIFPDRLKFAMVFPLYKKGDKYKMGNYRPISLLTTFSKIFEKVIYKRIYNHINKLKILSPMQFGFQTQLTTSNATYSLTHNILKSLDVKEYVVSIFFDLAKAFDCVDHEILLNKVQFYGIKGKFFNLIKSYLGNRQQIVSLKSEESCNVNSRIGIIQTGVPQGSVLGPLLFLLYVNDLPSVVPRETSVVLFADDTSVLVHDKNLDILKRKTKETMNVLYEWFSNNKLTVNKEKTKLINFCHTNKLSYAKLNTFLCNNIKIEIVEDIKFLGLKLDNKLNWNAHSEYLIPKLHSALFTLRYMSNIVNLSVLKSIYFGYFHSLISYGVIFWGNSTDAERIFKLQKTAVRILARSKSRMSCKHLFKKFNILTLPGIYILSVLMFLNKNLTNFTSNQDIHFHNTRSKNNLHLPTNRLTMQQKGLHLSAIKIFNKLPHVLKSCFSKDAKIFKKTLKKYLLTNVIYSIKDFLN